MYVGVGIQSLFHELPCLMIMGCGISVLQGEAMIAFHLFHLLSEVGLPIHESGIATGLCQFTFCLHFETPTS